MNKELELEALKYAESQKIFWEGFDSQMRRVTFTRYSLEVAYKKGATSEWVEKQKLQFAIDVLKSVNYQPDSKFFWITDIGKKIKELEQQLNQL